jgi:hypothetical protein
MGDNEELEKYQKEIFNNELRIKKEQLKSQYMIYLFAFLSLAGFIISIFSLRDAAMTGLVVGQREANLYGMMILVIFLAIWGFLLLQWFIVHKNKENM